MYNRAKN